MDKERGGLVSLCRLSLLCVCLVLCNGCAGRTMPPALYVNPVPAFEGTVTLTQRVRLAIPQADLVQNFTAVATVSMPHNKARVVAISGPGLTFFDVSMNGPDAVVHYIHPSFRRIPGAEEHILWSVRLVLLHGLAAQAPAPAGQTAARVPGSVQVSATDPSVCYTLSPEGRLLTAKQTKGDNTLWTLAFNDYDGLWPGSARLEATVRGFSVQITTYNTQREP